MSKRLFGEDTSLCCSTVFVKTLFRSTKVTPVPRVKAIRTKTGKGPLRLETQTCFSLCQLEQNLPPAHSSLCKWAVCSKLGIISPCLESCTWFKESHSESIPGITLGNPCAAWLLCNIPASNCRRWKFPPFSVTVYSYVMHINVHDCHGYYQ